MRQPTRSRKSNIPKEEPIQAIENAELPTEAYITSDAVIQMEEYKEEKNLGQTSKKFGRSKVTIWTLLVIGLFVVGRYGYSRYERSRDPRVKTEEEIQQIVSKVGELMLLPADEDPTIATVSDLEKLKGQEFFAHAEVGDKVLLYTKARKAILYSPGKNKIVEVAPINLPVSTPDPKK